MTKPLTPEQVEFLRSLLSMRPHTKTPLKGRQLDKIKGQYADFDRRRHKTEDAVAELEAMHGVRAAAPFRDELDSICGIVDAGANTGDETVFATAYKRLDSVKKSARDVLDELNAKARAIETASATFERAAAAIKGASPGKQKALAQALVDRSCAWLADHQGASVPRINAVLEEAQVAFNTPLTAKQSKVFSTHLANETGELCEEADLFVDNGMPEQVEIPKITALRGRVSKALQDARLVGNVVAVSQLQTAMAQLDRAQLRADPPPLDDPDEDAAPVSGAAKLLTAKIETLTDEEQAERVLLKAGSLSGQARSELDVLLTHIGDARADFSALLTNVAALKNQLRDDLDLIENSLTSAESFAAAAGDELDGADAKLAEAGDESAKPDARKVAVKAGTGGCDQALANLSTADKSLGRAEGGIIYVRNKADAFSAIPRRIAAVDPKQLAAVLANVDVLPECDKVPGSEDERDMLKHLVLVSADANGSRAIVSKISDPASYDRQVQELMKTAKLGTQLVTGLVNTCQSIVNDAERYMDSTPGYGVDAALAAKLADVVKLAKKDAARFTVPVVARKSGDTGSLASIGVAVVGGGPIGLLAAVEARMAGASLVTVFEGRTDPYSRMNVLKIEEGSLKRFAAAGVFDQLFPNYDPSKTQVAAVKDIEAALEGRCLALGVKLQRDRFLLDVKRDEKGTVQLFFTNDPTPYSCDFLIVATGGSVASAQKHANNVKLSDKLGVSFQKAAVKDYAAVGLFKKDAEKAEKIKSVGWQYDFDTAETQYVVAQLTEEEFNDLGNNPRKLVERIQQTRLGLPQEMAPPEDDGTRDIRNVTDPAELAAAIETVWAKLLQDFDGIDNFYGRDKAKDEKSIKKCKNGALDQLNKTIAARAKGDTPGAVSPAEIEKSLMGILLAEFGVSRFPIELQQASNFASADGAGVLVGDSAATPHPSTAKGLNTGLAEMGAMHDLIYDLQRIEGDETKRKDALNVYDFEVKRRTDIMIDAGLKALEGGTASQITKFYWKRLQPSLAEWAGGSSWGGAWLKRLDAKSAGLKVAEDDVRDDRDWSVRENSVKSLRALLTALETAHRQLSKRGDELMGDKTRPVTDALPDELKKLLDDCLA